MSIGLEHKGEIVAGVVYDPTKDEMFVAEKGAGAYVNDRRLRVSGRRDLIETIFATGIPFGGRPELPRTLRELAALTPQTAGIRRWGSAALDLAYVAAGRCDGYWERGLNPWDVAAGLLLVREAGGFVGTIEGGGDSSPAAASSAANPNVFEPLRTILRGASVTPGLRCSTFTREIKWKAAHPAVASSQSLTPSGEADAACRRERTPSARSKRR